MEQLHPFTHALKRIVQRKQIALGVPRSEIRSNNDILITSPEIHDFTDSIYAPDQEAVQFVTELYPDLIAELTAQGLQHPAIILVGSSLHGGRKLKHLLSCCQPSDIDLILTSDNAVRRHISTKELADMAQRHVLQTNQRLGLDYTLCHYYNLTNEQNVNIHDTDHALSLLVHGHKTTLKMYNESSILPLAYYFEPSYPAMVNENNQKRIVSALRIITYYNPELCDELVKTIANSWTWLKEIKPSAFWHDSYTDRDAQLHRQLLLEFRSAQRKNFIRYLKQRITNLS